MLRADGLELDVAEHSVRLDGDEVHLTPTEFELLRTLMANRGRLMTHRRLLTRSGAPPTPTTWPTLRTHIANLRRKVEPDGAARHIRTEAGIGYRFVD